MLVSNAPSHGPVLKPDTWTVTWWLSCCFHREDMQPSKLRWVQIGINLSFGATSNLTPGIVLCVQPRHSETFAPFLRSPRSLLDSSQETWYPTVNNEIFWGNSVQKKRTGILSPDSSHLAFPRSTYRQLSGDIL